MKPVAKTYTVINHIAAILMVVTLLWLTISTPFVNANQQKQDTFTQSTNPDSDFSDSDERPITNTTEEKTETNINSLSEYLHHMEELSQLSIILERHNCSHEFSVYVAFHGEMLCPPPNPVIS